LLAGKLLDTVAAAGDVPAVGLAAALRDPGDAVPVPVDPLSAAELLELPCPGGAVVGGAGVRLECPSSLLEPEELPLLEPPADGWSSPWPLVEPVLAPVPDPVEVPEEGWEMLGGAGVLGGWLGRSEPIEIPSFCGLGAWASGVPAPAGP
jgi:hypothetical protein